MKNSIKSFLKLSFFSLIIFSFTITSCDEQNDSLAPYVGSPNLNNITIEEGSYKPKITWLGGYVSVFGVNIGDKAALDSTLVFLIYKTGNDVRYPVTFGEIPSGAQDLTNQYGGTKIESLEEDRTYTFWLLKEAEWNQISSMPGKILVYDSTLSTPLQIDGDTVRLSGEVHSQLTKPLDVYINIIIDITGTNPGGRLILNGGTITVKETNTSNNPVISWVLTQVEDSLIAAIGISEGSTFSADREIWSVYSVSDSGGQPQYGKVNVISAPLIAGEDIPGTQVFVEYPEGGLKKNTDYYLWIAEKSWNGEGRFISTNNYGFVKFRTK